MRTAKTIQFSLVPHPMAPPRHPTFDVFVRIETAARSDRNKATIVYGVSAPSARFSIPTTTAPKRADNLWQTTCFEAFIRDANTGAYREWNFAPAGDWAAYDFAGYRQAMANADVRDAPYIQMVDHRRWWTVTATIFVNVDARLQTGLSAVLEERDGTLSYWALAHPLAERADFHHPGSFRELIL